MRTLAPLALALVLAACSATEPASVLDPLSQALLRATSEVPAFGGVALDGEAVTLYVLGAEQRPEAEAVAERLFDGLADAEVRVRPARGQGSEHLKEQVAAVTFGRTDAVSADYDETTGYVRLGVLDAAAVRQAQAALAETLPEWLHAIVVQVEPPVVAL